MIIENKTKYQLLLRILTETTTEEPNIIKIGLERNENIEIKFPADMIEIDKI